VKRLRYHAAAAEEAEQAAAWYFAERTALGLDFERELSVAVSLLRQSPIPSTPYPRLPKKLGVHKITFKRFPYNLVFVERDNSLLILAIAHQARRPGYWKRRLRS
jgi:plasmid stabilization system protein ParE